MPESGTPPTPQGQPDDSLSAVPQDPTEQPGRQIDSSPHRDHDVEGPAAELAGDEHAGDEHAADPSAAADKHAADEHAGTERTDVERAAGVRARDRLGAEPRRERRVEREAHRAPVKKEDLRRGSEDLTHEERYVGPAPQDAETRGPRVNWVVFLVSSAIILAFSLFTIFAPTTAADSMLAAVTWISTNLGWFYVLTVTLVILFVLWIAFSKEGGVRLGPDHSRPEYKLFTWVAMLFAARVGIDMLLYSVTGPSPTS